MKKNVANIAFIPALPPPIVTATAHIDSSVRGKHPVRLELTNQCAAAQAADHEQTKTDRTQPFGCLQPGHTRIILEDVVHAKAEYSRLRRNIKELGGNSKGEMLASEQIPLS